MAPKRRKSDYKMLDSAIRRVGNQSVATANILAGKYEDGSAKPKTAALAKPIGPAKLRQAPQAVKPARKRKTKPKGS